MEINTIIKAFCLLSLSLISSSSFAGTYTNTLSKETEVYVKTPINLQFDLISMFTSNNPLPSGRLDNLSVLANAQIYDALIHDANDGATTTAVKFSDTASNQVVDASNRATATLNNGNGDTIKVKLLPPLSGAILDDDTGYLISMSGGLSTDIVADGDQTIKSGTYKISLIGAAYTM